MAGGSRVFSVDGVGQDSYEYYGAVRLPYYDHHLQAGGTIYVTIEDSGVPGATELLHVFAEQIPLDTPRTLAVFVDNDRFGDDPVIASVGDIAVVYDFASSGWEVREARTIAPDVQRWVSIDPAEGMKAVSAGCTAGARFQLCNVEFQIPIPNALAEPTAGEAPGLGVAVVGLGADAFGSMPEELPPAPDPLFTPVCAYPSCLDDKCRSAVCVDDNFCCARWDGLCDSEAGGSHICTADTCATMSSLLCFNQSCYGSRCAADPYCCTTNWDGICESAAQTSDPTCLATSNCSGFTGYCEDLECRDTVCDGDPWCCTAWDSACENRAIANPGCNPADLPPQTFDRTLYQTLLFQAPPGTPFSIVSYNARRFSPVINAVNPDPFEPVTIDDDAQLLKDFDIVALQEFWVWDDAKALRDRINEISDPSKPPMVLSQPVQFDPSVANSLVEKVEELHGGIWLLSRFPIVDTAYRVYDDCRGEDCLKAKGVLWARVALNPATAENTAPDCTGPCPPPPTTEESIDVFVTHLQASDPLFCNDSSFEDFIRFSYVTNTGGAFFYAFNEDLFCSRTDSEVRGSQLTQLGQFIEEHANPRRQALVLGDFNIDGQFLNNDGSGGFGEYGEMLQLTGVIPPDRDTFNFTPDDTLPFGDIPDFSWALHHGDLARERFSAWGTSEGLGTLIPPETDVLDFPDRDGDTDPDGLERYDYILVRPGRDFKLGPDYVLARTGEPEAIFDITWPKRASDPPGNPPGGRFSDHMPVSAGLRLIPLRLPSGYHPAVPHHLTVRVTSAAAPGHDDCIWNSCAPLDLFVKMSMRRQDSLGAWSDVSPSPADSNICEGWHVENPPNLCIEPWRMDADQIVGDEQHRSSFRLYDSDSTSGNDKLFSVEGDRDPEVHVIWSTGEVRMRTHQDETFVPDAWAVDRVYGDPINWCTRADWDVAERHNEINLCLEVRIDEPAP